MSENRAQQRADEIKARRAHAAPVTIQLDGRFECPLCDHRSETVGEKKRHLRESHPIEVTDRG